MAKLPNLSVESDPLQRLLARWAVLQPCSLVPTPRTQYYGEATPHEDTEREAADEHTGQLQEVLWSSDIGVQPFGEPEQ